MYFVNGAVFETCYQSGLLSYLRQSSFNNSFQVSGNITNQNKMAKKVFLSTKRAIPSAQIPFVSREEIASSSGNSP